MARVRPTSQDWTLQRLGEEQVGVAAFGALGWLKTASVAALGDARILGRAKVGLFCSTKCPGDLILRTYDLARAWRDGGVTVISGFHSPMEKECLRILLRGTQPVIICPARSIAGMRIPRELREPLDDSRLLVVSPFEKKQRRMTSELAQRRNEFVVALADRVFVAYAAPGSKTETICRQIISCGKPLLTFDTEHNANLMAMGARAC